MSCWSCHRPHTGAVWCPHCSAPVDLNSEEARCSPFWADDPRNPDRIVCEVPGLGVCLDGPATDGCCVRGTAGCAADHPQPCPDEPKDTIYR